MPVFQQIPKELQRYLKNKELGYTDEQDFMIMEKENEASKAGAEKILSNQMNVCAELEVRPGDLGYRSNEIPRTWQGATDVTALT